MGILVIDPMPIMYELEFGNDLIKTATGPSTNTYKFHEKANATHKLVKDAANPLDKRGPKYQNIFKMIIVAKHLFKKI